MTLKKSWIFLYTFAVILLILSNVRYSEPGRAKHKETLLPGWCSDFALGLIAVLIVASVYFLIKGYKERRKTNPG